VHSSHTHTHTQPMCLRIGRSRSGEAKSTIMGVHSIKFITSLRFSSHVNSKYIVKYRYVHNAIVNKEDLPKGNNIQLAAVTY